MRFQDILLTANANMKRNKIRTALTIIAIFIGAFTLTLTNGLGAGISSYVNKQVGTIGQSDSITITPKVDMAEASQSSDEPQEYDPNETTSTNSGFSPAAGPPGMSTAMLTAEDIDEIKAYTELKDVQPDFSISPDYIQGSTDKKYKISTSAFGGTTLDLSAGEQLSMDSTDNQLSLPLNYVSSLGFASDSDAVGKSVTIGITDATGTQHSVTATIVGVQQEGLIGGGGLVVNTVLKNSLYDLQTTGLPDASKNKYSSATATLVGSSDDEAYVESVRSKLSDMGYSVTTLADQLGAFNTVISSLTYVLNAFAVIALVAAGFGIVNTLLMSVQERTKEIGLMKAMGMRSGRIFALFSIEAILIGFWGSALGIGVAAVVGTVANQIASNTILQDLPGFNLIAFPIFSIGAIMLLIMAIAFIAGTLPARKAAALNPIDALRYE